MLNGGRVEFLPLFKPDCHEASSDYAADPFPFLDEAGKKKMTTAHSGLWRKLTDVAFDESAEARWQASQRTEAENIEMGPATEKELEIDLFESSENPF